MNWTTCCWPGCRADAFAVWGHRCAYHATVPWPRALPQTVGKTINLGVGRR